jgi:hypothetical protein
MALQELNGTTSGKHTRLAGGIDIGQAGAAKYMIKEQARHHGMALIVVSALFRLPQAH